MKNDYNYELRYLPLFYDDVLFKERSSSYISSLAKDVKERVLNKKMGKPEKTSIIQNIKKGLGIVTTSKVTEAAANTSGNFDLTNLLLTVHIMDDTPSYRTSGSDGYVPSSNHSSRNDDHHSHHSTTSKHSCSSSDHSSSSHHTSSCGSSCSSCGGGGGD